VADSFISHTTACGRNTQTVFNVKCHQNLVSSRFRHNTCFYTKLHQLSDQSFCTSCADRQTHWDTDRRH